MKNDRVNSRNERRDLSACSVTKISIPSGNFHVTQTSAGHPTWSDFTAWQLWQLLPGLPRPSFPILRSQLASRNSPRNEGLKVGFCFTTTPNTFCQVAWTSCLPSIFRFQSFSFSFSSSRSLCHFWVEVHSEKVSYVAPICGKRFRYSQSDCCSLSSALFDRKKVEAEKLRRLCDRSELVKYFLDPCLQLRQWLYPENTTSSRRGKRNLSTTNGMYLRALQRKACLLPEVSPFLFQTTTGLMWSSLCTGGILAGKAPSPSTSYRPRKRHSCSPPMLGTRYSSSGRTRRFTMPR